MIRDPICLPVDRHLRERRLRVLTSQPSSHKKTSELQDDKKIPLYYLFKKIKRIFYDFLFRPT
jgi:hypothetical protein